MRKLNLKDKISLPEVETDVQIDERSILRSSIVIASVFLVVLVLTKVLKEI
jgi:hypothetical protein